MHLIQFGFASKHVKIHKALGVRVLKIKTNNTCTKINLVNLVVVIVNKRLVDLGVLLDNTVLTNLGFSSSNLGYHIWTL